MIPQVSRLEEEKKEQADRVISACWQGATSFCFRNGNRTFAERERTGIRTRRASVVTDLMALMTGVPVSTCCDTDRPRKRRGRRRGDGDDRFVRFPCRDLINRRVTEGGSREGRRAPEVSLFLHTVSAGFGIICRARSE